MSGDVAEPGLGLTEEVGPLDLVVHCAAVTAFNLDAATYRRVNQGGAANVLAFAAGRGVPLLHVSTAYVCGECSGPVAEAPAQGGRLANGYEASKAAAEALVIGSGHPVAVARPSIVVGGSEDGAVGAFGDVYQMLRLVAQGQVRVLPASAGASLDLVPIDHVVGGLVDIAERIGEAVGRVFHLASGAPMPVAELVRLAAGFAEVCPPRLLGPEQFDPACLSPREERLHRQATALYATYLRRDPRFVTENLRALSGRVCPPTDAAFLRRLVAFAVGAGFLPGGSAHVRVMPLEPAA